MHTLTGKDRDGRPLADSSENGKRTPTTVPEAGKRLKIGRNQAYAAAKPGEQNRPARRPKQTRRRLGRPQRLK